MEVFFCQIVKKTTTIVKIKLTKKHNSLIANYLQKSYGIKGFFPLF